MSIVKFLCMLPLIALPWEYLLKNGIVNWPKTIRQKSVSTLNIPELDSIRNCIKEVEISLTFVPQGITQDEGDVKASSDQAEASNAVDPIKVTANFELIKTLA